MSRAAAPKSRTSLAPSVAFTILALILSVGAYVIAGFGKRGQLPATFALYVTIFAAGYAGALLVTRVFAPRADPALFPTAAVLVGLGFAMIFRLSGGLAAEQATWIVVGLIAYALTLIVVRDAPDARRVHLHDRPARSCCCCSCRSRPASAGRSTGRGCGCRSGRSGSSRPRSARCSSSIFLASYLNQKRELLQVATVAARAVPAPAGQAPRARPARLGRLARDPVPAEGSRRLAAVLRDLRRDALGRDGPRRVPGDRADPVRRRRVRGVAAVRPRPAARRHLAARARPGEGVRAGLRAARAGAVRDGERRDRRDRARPGIARPDPVRVHRLHLRGDRRGARAARHHGGAAPGPRARRQGAARRRSARPTASRRCSRSACRRWSRCRRS